MQFIKEKVRNVWDEIQSLLQKNFEETGIQGAKLNPNRAYYEYFEELEKLHLVVARNNANELIGHSVFLILEHHQYSGQIFAAQDTFFVLPKYRGITAMKFFDFVERDLEKLNVDFIMRQSCPNADWSNVLALSGYKEKETLFIKKVEKYG